MRTCLTMIVVFALMMVTIPTAAQISITTTDVLAWYAVGKAQRELQRSGDQFTYTFNAGNPSTTVSQSWTLPTVQYTDTMMLKNAVPSTTPYTSTFPTATHAQVIEMNSGGVYVAMYVYVRIVNDSVYSLGSAFRQKYSTVDTTTFDKRIQFMVKLPIGITSSFAPMRDSIDRGSGAYDIENSTEAVDGFGTITMPNGSFASLRTKETSKYRKFTPPSKIDTFTVVRYHWYTKEGHSAQVAATYSDTTVGTIRVTEVRYSALITAPTGVARELSATPTSPVLFQNYPNPFNPTTEIQYQTTDDSHVTLSVSDVLGREVAVLVNESRPAGIHKVTWNAAHMPSGMYFYRLTSGSTTEVRRMVLMK